VRCISRPPTNQSILIPHPQPKFSGLSPDNEAKLEIKAMNPAKSFKEYNPNDEVILCGGQVAVFFKFESGMFLLVH